MGDLQLRTHSVECPSASTFQHHTSFVILLLLWGNNVSIICEFEGWQSGMASWKIEERFGDDHSCLAPRLPGCPGYPSPSMDWSSSCSWPAFHLWTNRPTTAHPVSPESSDWWREMAPEGPPGIPAPAPDPPPPPPWHTWQSWLHTEQELPTRLETKVETFAKWVAHNSNHQLSFSSLTLRQRDSFFVNSFNANTPTQLTTCVIEIIAFLLLVPCPMSSSQNTHSESLTRPKVVFELDWEKTGTALTFDISPVIHLFKWFHQTFNILPIFRIFSVKKFPLDPIHTHCVILDWNVSFSPAIPNWES